MQKCCKRVKTSSLVCGALVIVSIALLLVMAFALPYFKGIFTGLCQAFIQQISDISKVISAPVLIQVSLVEVFVAFAIAWLVVTLVKRRPIGLLQVLGVLIVGFLSTVSAFLFTEYAKDGVTYNYFFGALNGGKTVELILMIAYLVLVGLAMIGTVVTFVFVCKCPRRGKECSCAHEEVAPVETPTVSEPTPEPVAEPTPEPVAEPESKPVVQPEIAPDANPAVIIKPEPAKVSLSSPDKEARAQARVKAKAQAEATRKIEQARLEKLKKEQAAKKEAEAKKAADKAKKEKEKAQAAKAKKSASSKKSTVSSSEQPKVYHVSQHKDGKWQVKAAKGEKALKLFDTQAEAIEYAKEVSKNQAASIRVHSLSGKIRKA